MSLVSLVWLSSSFTISVTWSKWKIKRDKERLFRTEQCLNQSQDPSSGSPNIILIVGDDFGKYEVSAYPGVDHITMPNIDRIAAEGVLFGNDYVTASTCSPSRASLMTGRVQNRYGFETQIMKFYPANMVEYLSGKYFIQTGDFVLDTRPQYPSAWQVAKQGVSREEILLSQLIKRSGYTTWITGQWQLGTGKGQRPLARGFDEQYGFMGAFSLYSAEQNTNGVVNHAHESFLQISMAHRSLWTSCHP